MKTKYIPGPWDTVEGKTLLHIETAYDNPNGAGIPICSIPKKSPALARLLTQAPAMAKILAVLIEHAKEQFPHFESPRGQREIADAERILAAINGEVKQ